MAQEIVSIDSAKPIQSSIERLKLPPLPLLMLLGGFDPALNLFIKSICRRVLAPIAVSPGALILDDARCSGCAAAMGEAARDQDEPPPLLGLIPADRETADVDPNHQRVLQLPLEWLDTVRSAFVVADHLTARGTAQERPALAILFGGGDLEKSAVLRCAARNWPVVVVGRSGGLADQILNVIVLRNDGSQSRALIDPDLREIVESATIFPFSLDGNMDDFERILLSRIDLHPETAACTIRDAWCRFDELDTSALRKQKFYRKLEFTLIALVVLATISAILTSASSVPITFRNWSHAALHVPRGALHYVVLLTPIAISVVGAYNGRFRDGYKWILLRGAAEAIKREIFVFRAQAGIYSAQQCFENSRESKLAAKIKDITSALEQSEANKSSIVIKQSGDAARETVLKPEEYIAERLRDQIHYFARKTHKLSRQLALMQAAVYIAGAAGTLLASIRLDIWVALATAIVTATTAKLQADQVENRLVTYNQALTSLRNIESWWKALSPWEKKRRRNIDLLVEQTELTLQSETAGWVQKMQSALDRLAEKEPSPEQKPKAAVSTTSG